MGYKRDTIDRLIVTSDLHLWHKNIILYDGRTKFLNNEHDCAVYGQYLKDGRRGVEKLSDDSINSMNDAILSNIANVVQDPDRDTVVIAGDFVFGDRDNYRKRAIEAIHRIGCRDIRIIWGNHDRPDDIHDLFTFCYDQAYICCQKVWMFFNHYPMISWRDSHRGSILCFGHVHGKVPIKIQNSIDVGIMNNNYKPYLFEQIINTINEAKV